MFYWYCERKQFSRIFGIEAPEWTMSTVNLQKIWSEYVHLKKNLSLLKEVAIFSIISFKIGFFGIVIQCYFPVFFI